MSYLYEYRSLECPTCHVAGAFFLDYGLPDREKKPGRGGALHWADSKRTFSALCHCGHCHSPTLIVFEIIPETARQVLTPDRLREFAQGLIHIPDRDKKRLAVNGRPPVALLNAVCRVQMAFPAVPVDIPENLPDHIHTAWSEDLLNILASARHSVLECRRILELMCKDKGATRGNLQNKIDWLVEQGLLTKDIGDWAHEVRFLGNESVHEEGPIKPEYAREIHDITKIIAEILYTYPARIERFRLRRGGDV